METHSSEHASRGVAWVMGRSSVPATGSWAPVVIGRELDRTTFERRTAETLVTLIIEATSTIRLFTPFLDPGRIGAVAHALAAATARGVFRPLRLSGVRGPRRRGALLVALPESESFPRLKLLVTDGQRAYIGGANFTCAGLTYNVEVGAVVEGGAVDLYERLLDTLRPEFAARREPS